MQHYNSIITCIYHAHLKETHGNMTFLPLSKEALFAIFVQYDANLDGRVRGSESKQLLKVGRILPRQKHIFPTKRKRTKRTKMCQVEVSMIHEVAQPCPPIGNRFRC